jgi:DNA-binding response OmpR family regulator
MTKKITILWADDEIELLKPHIIFLEAKGYEVIPVNNGIAAVEYCKNQQFDIIFLDEQMPGLSGLDTLVQIKSIHPHIPIVMITKSEAEDIMEAAIGSQINDYLIKPVNPNQILLSIKKNIQQTEIITQKTTMNYQQEFSQLGILIMQAETWNDWVEIFKKLTQWEIQLTRSNDRGMDEVLRMQKNEANTNFAKCIKKNYIQWIQSNSEDKPILSPSLFKDKIYHHIQPNTKTLVLVIDNLRYDHWISIRPLLNDYYTIQDESLYCSILPTSTQYARNALFAGLMPLEISKIYPDLWINDEENEQKNQYEESLFISQLKRLGYTEKIYFEKITAINPGKKVIDKIHNILQHQLSVIVYNFVDTLSHARTEMQMIKELANDEAAYRSLTISWFSHSSLFELLKEISKKGVNLIITTDHGAVRVQNPIKVVGDKTITTNLRYKQGKALVYNPKEVFEIKKPQEVRLPSSHISSSYIFATEQDFFAYPNNFNHYVQYYRDSFQHGGISMEEMIVPCIYAKAK